MSISVGGIDLANSIINLEYELNRTQRLLEWIVRNNPTLHAPPPQVMAQIDAEAIEALQKKFPEAGIQKK
jgi:hypothetical protein